MWKSEYKNGDDAMKVLGLPARLVPLSIKKILLIIDRVKSSIDDTVDSIKIHRFCSRNPKLIGIYKKSLNRK